MDRLCHLLREAAIFVLGFAFALTLLPPLLIIGAIAVIAGPIDRVSE